MFYEPDSLFREINTYPSAFVSSFELVSNRLTRAEPNE